MRDDAQPEPPRPPAITPERLDARVIRTVAGTALAHPWFDSSALFALRHWFFPMSRLWAAARQAHGDVDRFYASVPMPPRFEDRARLTKSLAAFEQARVAAYAIEAEWERAFFGPDNSTDDSTAGNREAVEAARISLRHAYNATRRHFRWLVNRDVPRVKLALQRQTRWPQFTALPPMVILRASRRHPIQCPRSKSHGLSQARQGRDFWLRFKSPSARLGDSVYARVHEPIGVSNPPTIIFGHGICVEYDHWKGLIDECRRARSNGLSRDPARSPLAWTAQSGRPIRRRKHHRVVSDRRTRHVDRRGAGMGGAGQLGARDLIGPLAFSGSSLRCHDLAVRSRQIRRLATELAPRCVAAAYPYRRSDGRCHVGCSCRVVDEPRGRRGQGLDRRLGAPLL